MSFILLKYIKRPRILWYKTFDQLVIKLMISYWKKNYFLHIDWSNIVHDSQRNKILIEPILMVTWESFISIIHVLKLIGWTLPFKTHGAEFRVSPSCTTHLYFFFKAFSDTGLCSVLQTHVGPRHVRQRIRWSS